YDRGQYEHLNSKVSTRFRIQNGQYEWNVTLSTYDGKCGHMTGRGGGGVQEAGREGMEGSSIRGGIAEVFLIAPWVPAGTVGGGLRCPWWSLGVFPSHANMGYGLLERYNGCR
ncbi:hypothetical protein Tco_0245744, partial [Tanacetum coccineum]